MRFGITDGRPASVARTRTDRTDATGLGLDNPDHYRGRSGRLRMTERNGADSVDEPAVDSFPEALGAAYGGKPRQVD